jgi:prevent-host-death family protein
MKNHAQVIGAFEAKTHLSDLLRRVENGEEFHIHRRGRPVARLVPMNSQEEDHSLHRVVAAMREIRDQASGTVSIRELIDEGRRL